MGGKSSVQGRRSIMQSTASYDEHNYSHQQWPSSSSSVSSSHHDHHHRHRRHHPRRPSKGYYDSHPMAYPADSSSYFLSPAGYPPASNPVTAYPADPSSHRLSPAGCPPGSNPVAANKTTTTSYSRDSGKRAKLETKFSRITDDFTSLTQVTEALAQAGLESSNLIVGVDFTKSNEWTGKNSFHGRSLHHVGTTQNPYEHAISIIGRTLSAFDEDNLIPCFGFGDASTHDQDVFGFYPGERPCSGFEEALDRYREIAPKLRLAGPTSFAPIIEMAMTIVEQSGGQYHVLVIIADGQVTRSVDTAIGRLSPQEQKTVETIVKASEFPLSIILVGVGDGPWDMMQEFDDNIPTRSFDNFQFVNFTSIMSKNAPESRKETEFALAALMEIPLQYRATLDLGILGQHRGTSPRRRALPPPVDVSPAAAASLASRAFESAYPDRSSTPTATAPPENASWDTQACPVCLSNPRNMAFGCGHQTCQDCGPLLTCCPICRSSIQTRIKLY